MKDEKSNKKLNDFVNNSKRSELGSSDEYMKTKRNI